MTTSQHHAVAFCAAIVVTIAACAAPGHAATGSRRVSANRPAAAQEREDTIVVGGRTRTYLVHDFSQGTTAPMVILLHGGGGNGANMVNMTQFDSIARREHLVAVYPNGSSRPGGDRLLTWNATHCCAYAMREHVDDVGFISALIDRMVASGRVDASRVYVTGMSNGAMMTHVIGRELANKLAAIATVVGALWGDEPLPQGPVPALIIVGQVDHTVPGAGGPINLAVAGGEAGGGLRGRIMERRMQNNPPADRDAAPAIAQAEYWSRADGCTGSTMSLTSAAQQISYAGCRTGMDVEYYVVTGNGHAWPGGRPGRAAANPPVQDFNASEAIWKFFSAHRRER
jgi:polyhydroxybutyrate depolymerase